MPTTGLLSANDFLVAAKSEATYGTDPFGSTIDEFIGFEEFSVTSELEIVEDEVIRGVHSGYEDQRFGSSCSVSWTLPITGKAADAGDAPLWNMLLKSGNFAETINAATSVEYSLITGMSMTDVPSVSYAYYMLEQERDNARLMKIHGCRGNRTLSFEMGQVARISGEDTGLFTDFPDATVSIPDNPTTYTGNKKPLLVVGMTAEIGGSAYALESVSIETNWNIVEDRDATTAGSTLAHVGLTRSVGNRVGGEMAIKGRAATLNTIVGKLRDGDTFALHIELSDGTDTFELDCPSIQFGNYSESRDGHVHFGLPFFCNATGAGENEIKLTFS